MITRVDLRLRREALQFQLRFTCESCANFDPSERRCGNGFPVAPHLGTDLERTETLVFCKDFELR